MNAHIVTRHLFISGRVQGVSFRASMVVQATRLGTTGWVRNRSDGRVEALVQGHPDTVEQIIAWAHGGPPRAQVTGVVVADAARGDFVAFRQRATV